MTDGSTIERISPDSSPEVFEVHVRQKYNLDAKVGRWQTTSSGERTPVLVGQTSGIEWLLIPAGGFQFGISAAECDQVLALSKQPFLTLDEMKPSTTVQMPEFLMMVAPIASTMVGGDVNDSVGVGKAHLCDYKSAAGIADRFGAALPTEREWEYACRAGRQSLFWFGDHIPAASAMERILGLRNPESTNGFGLVSLFFGEWCSDYWTSNHGAGSVEDIEAGHVIRGGAARFWPWHDDREWSGCVSAFRMPERDSGGAGAAVRLVRRAQAKER